MEFLRSSSKRQSLFSEAVYIALNIILAVVVLGLVLVVQSPWLAILAVVISKWRIFAVRPRYWRAHLQTNAVDAIVSISMAVLIYAALGSIGTQIFITVLYGIWLLVIKPQSKRAFMAVQAGCAVFLGSSALFAVAYDWSSSLVVVAVWVIGYAAARHVLSTYDEVHRSFYSIAWGFTMAELGWLFYHWTFTYTLPGIHGVKFTQAAIIFIVINFLAYRVYDSIYRNKDLYVNDILLPLLLSASVATVLLIFFNTLPLVGSI